MEPENQPADRLDAQLDTLLSLEGQRDVSADRELAAPLAAASSLAALRQAELSAEFARSLEQQVLARAESLREGQDGQEARQLLAAPFASIHDALTQRPARSHPTGARGHSAGIPKTLWPLLAASVLLALGVGTFSAAAHAAPGSPLYAIHRTVEDAQVQLASSQDQRVQLHLQYADEALTNAGTAARSGDNSAYATALTTLQSETTAATQALAALPAGADTQTLARQLSDLQARSAQVLAHDLASSASTLTWANRLATTSALAGLGVAVPQIRTATLTRQDGQGQQNVPESTRTDHVVVSGGGFETGAKLVANGELVSQVTLISLAPEQLTASVPRGALDGAHTIGISNPDGTAAQTTNISQQQDAGNANGGDNGGKGSNATPTATPDHGKGKHP